MTYSQVVALYIGAIHIIKHLHTFNAIVLSTRAASETLRKAERSKIANLTVLKMILKQSRFTP